PECAPARPAPVVEAPPPPAPVVRDDRSSAGSTQRTLAIVVGVVGVAALGAGTGFGLSASSKKGDLESAGPSYPDRCPLSRRSELLKIADDADSFATISTIGFIAGGALLLGAGILYFTASKGASTKTAWSRPGVSF